MRFFWVVLWLAFATLALAPAACAAIEKAVAIEPSCPNLTIGDPPDYRLSAAPVTIRYNSRAADARIKSTRELTLVLANAIGPSRLDSRSIPMTRLADGSWETTYTSEKIYGLGYSMFFFQGENNQVDNNNGDYWEILRCFHSQAEPTAVEMQACSYEGRLLAPGIQRAPDLDRAIAILTSDLKARPNEARHFFFLWDLELQKGAFSQAAYEKVGMEIESFTRTHGTDFRAMRQILGFIAGQQRKLPAKVVDRFRSAWTALPQTADAIRMNAGTKELIHIPETDGPAIARFAAGVQKDVTRGLAQMDYQAIESDESDARKKAAAYLAFAAKYHDIPGIPNPYGDVFLCEKEIGDLTAAEAMFDKWTATEPTAVQPKLEMAKLYIEQKIHPDRVLDLLDAVQKIYTESELPGSHVHFRRQAGQLESLRGQAHLLLKDLVAARADFASAVKVAPDDEDYAFALGRTCEQMGDTAGAMDAYLEAASAPYELNSVPREAYVRLFVSQGSGNRIEAEQQINRRAAARTQSAEEEYVPVAMNRPAPDFSFMDLSGKPFDNQLAKGRPTVITFWGIWCPPCISELPALAEFQKQHPDVNMLAVAIGNTPEEVQSFLAEHKLSGLHAGAQMEWPTAFGANGTPTSVVMDRFVQIQFFHVGRPANVEAILSRDVGALPEAR